MYICISISWDYPRRGRVLSKCIAASSMPGKGRAAVIYTRRRFLEFKSYGGETALWDCSSATTLSCPFLTV